MPTCCTTFTSGAALDIVEDVLPLHDVTVAIRAAREPHAVTLVPEGLTAPFSYADGYVTVQIARIDGYQIVELAGAVG